MTKILVVDDSTVIRQMVKFTLTSKGHTIIEAVDGKDGLLKLGSNQVDLILTDQNMPNMTGIDFIKAVRRLPNGKKVPVLFLTTESSPALKSQAKEAGATGWLVKPFDPPKLLEVVSKIIG